MLGGTRSAVRRNRDRVRNRNDDEPPPPPSAAEIMMEAEKNKRDQTRLLELIEQNTARQRNVVVSIQDFILLKRRHFDVLLSPLKLMIGSVPSSVSLTRHMLLPMIELFFRYTSWKVLLFNGGRTMLQCSQMVT